MQQSACTRRALGNALPRTRTHAEEAREDTVAGRGGGRLVGGQTNERPALALAAFCATRRQHATSSTRRSNLRKKQNELRSWSRFPLLPRFLPDYACAALHQPLFCRRVRVPGYVTMELDDIDFDVDGVAAGVGAGMSAGFPTVEAAAAAGEGTCVTREHVLRRRAHSRSVGRATHNCVSRVF